MNKISVFQISPFFSPNVGGVETHLNDLLNYTDGRNIINTVITYQPLVGSKRGKSFERKGNNRIYRISWFKNIFYKTEKYPLLHFIYLTPYITLRSLILMVKERKKIDIIHSHGINATVAGALVKRIFHKPLVVSLHNEFNLSDSFSTKYILWILKQADYILTLTEKSKRFLIENEIDQDKIRVYSYWVNQKIFKPFSKDIIRRKLKWNKNFTVLFVGRLVREKGVELLLEVAKKMPEVKFVLAGSGPLESTIKQYRSSFRNVIFFGKVPNNHLVSYYCGADILIVPSLVETPRPEYEDGNPRVIIEAISCGLPVIATDNGGIKEIVTKGQVGIICNSERDDLMFAINKMRNNKTLIQYRKRTRNYALTYFGENNGLEFLKIYNEFTTRKNIEFKLRKLLINVGDMALKRRAKSIIENLELRVNKKILDVGCGDGFYLHLLSNLGINLKLTGVDIDIKGLESARRNLGKRKISLIQADLIKRLPFNSNNFDGVITSEVLEHLLSDLKGLKEVYRVLRPSGILTLTVPCKNYPFLWDPVNWILEHLFNTHIRSGFWAGIWNQHLRLYQLEQIKQVCQKAGFKIEDTQIQTFWCIPFNHNLINLGARMIVSDKLPESFRNSASKFSQSKSRSINLAIIFFTLVNFIDKLNEILPFRSSGVSIFIKARK